MEVDPCSQEASSHAMSLLASLNFQREQAQFCDCVVRQRQNPGQLHPAHRCVLAASSPVLASILSSTGALVELQVPCMSDAVLALLLDYIYTGALPYTSNQHQYYNLLAVASYLQMDELQKALRVWRQTKVKVTDNTNGSSGAENQPYKDITNTYSETVNNFSLYLPLSLGKEDHQYSAYVDTCDDKDRTSSKNGASSLSNANTCCSTSKRSVNTGNCKQVTYLTPQALIQSIPCIAEVHGVSGVDKEVQNDLFHSAGIEEELDRKVEDSRNLFLICPAEVQEKQTNRNEEDKTPLHYLPISHFKDSVSPSQCSSSSSSSSPHPCSGAVPVIRHSSSAAMLQPAEVSTTPHPYHPLSNKDHLIGQNDKHLSNSLSHMTDHNDHHAHFDSFQSENHTEHFREDSMPRDKDCYNFTSGLQYKSYQSFNDFSSKHRRLNCFDCLNLLMATAAEEQFSHSQDPRAVVPPPRQNSDMESDSHCEDLCSEEEAKEEHSYSRCPAETDRLKTDWNPNLQRAEISSRDDAFSQHEHNRDPAMTKPVSTPVKLEKIPDIEITEPHLTFTMSLDHNMSDSTCSAVGPSYRGHLQYHCLPHEASHGYSGSKHSHPSPLNHSDQSSDEEEIGTFAKPGYSPLRQHFTTGTTDQVLLLDISAKPAELLVAKAFSQKETFGNGFGNTEKEPWNEATSVAEVDTKYWVGETNLESVGTDQSRPGAKVIHRAGVVEEVSNHIDVENHASTLTVCSPPGVPDSVQASVSSTLSACIPSSLSASMPTNVSAHLSNPAQHSFQCSLCDRSFSQRGSLNRHVRSHLGVRPFSCPRCPMTFSRQYRVTEHMRVHQRCVLRSDFPQPPASSI